MSLRKKMHDPYAFSRFLYIIEAALEYFISILVGGAYLAKITASVGMSDSLTGILSSFISLGSSFQIVAIFLVRKQPVKRWVSSCFVITQLGFMMLYVAPLLNVSETYQTVGIVAFLLMAQILANIINPAKINWFMSLVDNDKRGVFTAKKEMVSLISGMLFTLAMGEVIDRCEAAGNQRLAFIIGAVTIFGLMLLHTLTLIFMKEKPSSKTTYGLADDLKKLICDKKLLQVVLVTVLWHIAQYALTPFLGTYQTKELAFTMTFISVISIASSIVRAALSIPIGKFADRFGFSKMLLLVFGIEAVALGVNIFTRPENGMILYPIYAVLSAAAMAGINSGEINLIYDYVSPENRTSALAIKCAFAGVAGFLSTLLMTPLVNKIQGDGNVFFGYQVYAQQVLSVFGFVMVIAILCYIRFVLDRPDRKNGGNGKKESAEPVKAIEETEEKSALSVAVENYLRKNKAHREENAAENADNI